MDSKEGAMMADTRKDKRSLVAKKDIDAAMMAAAPADALDIIDHLNKAGYDAYLVGGCVRDTLEGNMPHDWDITTSATPEQMKKSVPYKSIDTGLQHGTITFMRNGEPYETTVFRTDGDYSDGRHPDNVEFASTVEEDLSRRDFTVNAMAWSPKRGLVDPHGGFDDLESNKLRGVGDPKERFEEDGLRIMRAVRFAATHGYDIEDETARGMHETLDMLDNVSAERITTEMLKTMGAADGEHMAKIVDEFKDVVFKAVPELSQLDGFEQDNPNHDRNLWKHSIDTMASLPADPVLRFTGLVHDIGKPASQTFGEDGVAHYYGHMDEGRRIVDAMCERMKMSNEDKDRMAFLVGNHDNRPRETEKSARRFLVRMGSDERLEDMLTLMRSDISVHSPEAVARVMPRFEEACAFIAKEHEKSLAMKVSDLAVNGNTLMEMGWKPGPEMGAALNEMFAAVVDGEMDNDEKTLRAYADKVRREMDAGERVLSSNRKEFVRPDGTSIACDISNVKVDPEGVISGAVGVAAGGSAGAGRCSGSSAKKKRSGRDAGEGKVHVSAHVRGGVKVQGYFRSAPGKRK